MNQQSHTVYRSCLLFLFVFLSFTSTKAQWTPLNLTPTDNFEEVSFPSELVGYIAAQNDFFVSAPLFKTTNGGSSWDTIPYPIPAGHTTNLDLVEFVDAQTGFLIGQAQDTSMVFPLSESFMLKTTDGGGTWTDVTPSSTLNSPLMSFFDANQGLVSGVEELYQTTDGGLTWNASIIPNFGPFHLQLVSTTTGYIGGFELVNGTQQTGGVSKTTDGGATWSPLTYPGNYTLFRSAFFVDQDHGYLVGENPTTQLLHTTDGGQSWTTKPLSNTYGEELWFVNDSTGYLTEAHEIWKTVDYGDNWSLNLSEPQTRTINDIKFTGNLGIACGRDGMLYKLDLPTGIDETTFENGLQIFPNPVSATGQLHLHLPAGTSGTVRLMDLTGRVMTTRAIDANEQEHNLELAGLQLASGPYLAVISLSDGRFVAQKLIVTP